MEVEQITEVKSPVLYKFTNRPDSKDLDMLLTSFYTGVYTNQVGIMEAYNLDTEEVDMLIVGVELDEDGKPDCYPLARALRTSEMHRYLSPNGNGGFYDQANAIENAEVKAKMKPYKEENLE